GGGGYVVQRMASCKSEKDSLLATLWFQVAHYCVRPWPWLLVGFVALAKYPELRANWLADPNFDPGVGFPMMMRDLLPVGMRGLLLVAFFAAFMSTLATQINWGASYLVSDFYKRFYAPNADQKHLAWASRFASLIVLILGGIATYLMRNTSVDNAWKLLAALGAGTGAVFMLRWFWWRINAWSEISAMIASLVFFLIVKGFVKTGEYQTALVAALTVPTWLIITYLTPAESRQTLLNFYRKVRPGGPGWASIAADAPEVKPDRNLEFSFGAALCGVGLILTTLPGVGFLIFGAYGKAALCAAGAIACGVGISVLLNKAGWKEVAR
ncbi:MAG: sodium:proline symporter, partial [bacterium]